MLSILDRMRDDANRLDREASVRMSDVQRRRNERGDDGTESLCDLLARVEYGISWNRAREARTWVLAEECDRGSEARASYLGEAMTRADMVTMLESIRDSLSESVGR